MKDGRVKRDELPDDTPSGAQGWFINTRRQKFADPRLREALNDAFDFEWTNKTIMYGAYQRTVSVFQNSDMMAQGKPSAEELALLEPFRGRVPDEVFGEPYLPPVSDGSGQDRALLRKAAQLLEDAGCVIKNGKRVLPSGEPHHHRIPDRRADVRAAPHAVHQESRRRSASTPHCASSIRCNIARGATTSTSTSPSTASASRPRRAIRCARIFSSQAAALKGSNNLAGIADPAIDALIDAVIAADTRPALVTACRALDRVIRAGRYWIPHWYKASHWIAYWDVFGRPAAQPRYFRGIPETWWYDPDKAAKIRERGKSACQRSRQHVLCCTLP